VICIKAPGGHGSYGNAKNQREELLGRALTGHRDDAMAVTRFGGAALSARLLAQSSRHSIETLSIRNVTQGDSHIRVMQVGR
jgi:hypothetical protein